MVSVSLSLLSRFFIFEGWSAVRGTRSVSRSRGESFDVLLYDKSSVYGRVSICLVRTTRKYLSSGIKVKPEKTNHNSSNYSTHNQPKTTFKTLRSRFFTRRCEGYWVLVVSFNLIIVLHKLVSIKRFTSQDFIVIVQGF